MNSEEYQNYPKESNQLAGCNTINQKIYEGLNGSQNLRDLMIEIINTLKENGPLTRFELISKTMKPRTTIYDNIVKLIKLNIVQKYSSTDYHKGRPEVYFKLIE